MRRQVIEARYDNPTYVAAVEEGLRKTGTLDAEKHWIDDEGRLWFEDAVGNQVIFEAMGGQP